MNFKNGGPSFETAPKPRLRAMVDYNLCARDARAPRALRVTNTDRWTASEARTRMFFQLPAILLMRMLQSHESGARILASPAHVLI